MNPQERLAGWEGMERADTFRVAFDAAKAENDCLGGSCKYPIGGQCACFVEVLSSHRIAAIEDARNEIETLMIDQVAHWGNHPHWMSVVDHLRKKLAAIRSLSAPPPPPVAVEEGGNG